MEKFFLSDTQPWSHIRRVENSYLCCALDQLNQNGEKPKEWYIF